LLKQNEERGEFIRDTSYGHFYKLVQINSVVQIGMLEVREKTISQNNTTKFFYGYWIALVGLIFLFLYSGVGFYAFGIFFKPIQEEFNWSRGITSIAFTMLYLVQALSSPLIGKITDRYGPKKVITIGAIITSSGLTLLSFTSSLPYFYVSYAITGLGLSTIGMIPVSTAISNWFVRKRGLAIGIATSGVGLGGLVLAPIIGDVLIPKFGWRIAYQILAIFSGAIIVMLSQLVLRKAPKDIRLNPDGEYSKNEKLEGDVALGSGEIRFNDAIRSSTLYLIVGAFIMFNIGQVGTIQHLVNHMTDIGFPLTTAVGTISIIGLGSASGKFFFGYISDRLAPKYCTVISFVLTCVATVELILLNPSSQPIMSLMFGTIFGLGIGGWAPLSSVLTSHNFGLECYGAIYGVVCLFHNISTGMSPIFFGYVYDTSQSYYLAFITSVVLYLVAIILILAIRKPRIRLTSSSEEKKG